MSKFQCQDGLALSPCLIIPHKCLHLSLWIKMFSNFLQISYKFQVGTRISFMSRGMEIFKMKYHPYNHIFLYLYRRRSKFLRIMKILTNYLILWWKVAENHWETWKTLKKTKLLLKLLNHLRLIDGWPR